MMKVAAEYQSSEKLKIARRPKRSAMRLNSSVPTNIPAKSEAMKLAKPDAEEALGGRREDAALVQSRSDVGGEEEIVKLETSAERQQDDQMADVARVRQAIQPCRGRYL